MPWTPVNKITDTTSPLVKSKVSQHPVVDVENTANKHQINILKAAENLVRGRSRPRKHRCVERLSKSKSLRSRKPTPADSTATRDNQATGYASSHGHSNDGHHIMPTDLDVIPNGNNVGDGFVQFENHDLIRLEPVRNEERTDALASSAKCFPRSPATTIGESNSSADCSSPGREILDSSTIDHLSESNSLEEDVFVLESSEYGDFDDSIFDHALESLQSPDKPALTIDPEPLPAPQNPNASPFSPFLHPCLLDCLDQEIVPVDERDVRNPSLKHICFRTAEVLRLGKAFQNATNRRSERITIEMFATISEVRYANNQGIGQGVVFGDMFFPQRPPYVIAMSRIPYSHRDLGGHSPSGDGCKPIFKATILLTTTLPAPVTRYTASNPQKTLAQTESIAYEVLDIHTTSWDAVFEVKTLIEKDHRARNEGLAGSKHRITHYFPNIAAEQPSIKPTRGSKLNHVDTPRKEAVAHTSTDLTTLEDNIAGENKFNADMAQKTCEDLTGYEDEFSDVNLSDDELGQQTLLTDLTAFADEFSDDDISLPDLKDLLKGY